MGKYKILVVDKFCQSANSTDSSCHYCIGKYDTYQEAVKICQNFLDNDFESISEDCKTRDGFDSYWAAHGERLLICPDPKRKIDKFISEDYMEQKVKKYFKK